MLYFFFQKRLFLLLTEKYEIKEALFHFQMAIPESSTLT